MSSAWFLAKAGCRLGPGLSHSSEGYSTSRTSIFRQSLSVLCCFQDPSMQLKRLEGQQLPLSSQLLVLLQVLDWELDLEVSAEEP